MNGARYFLIYIFLFLSTYSYGISPSFTSATQEKEGFRLPLNLAISISGNYGELRSAHFHSGIDFRVGGVSGEPVYAAMGGYISRISVSPVGYGHAVYISHPNGRTTVYGHLANFSPVVAKWVEEMQYKRESFQVNLYPDSTKFPVKKGDLIGNAGNTGSSGGPHLHFEIRDSHSQIPLNPFTEAGYSIKDKTAPQIRRVNIYSARNVSSVPETYLISSFDSSPKNTVAVTDTFYIAVDAADKMEGTASSLAVTKYSYYLDNKLVYSFNPDRIPFDKGRYINSVVEYSEKQKSGRSLVKSFVEPGNGLRDKITSVNRGLFIVKDDSTHTLSVEVSDIFGNMTRWSFRVVKDPGLTSPLFVKKSENQQLMAWYLPNKYEKDGVSLSLPPGSLYRSILFEAATEKRDSRNQLIWSIGNPGIPIHNKAGLTLPLSDMGIPLEKLFVARLNDSGGTEYCGGEAKGGKIQASVSSFGRYFISADTTAPVVVPHFKNNQDLTARKSIKFTVKDDISGISEYSIFIDGKWALHNWDPKSLSLTVKLDKTRLNRGSSHSLEIIVKDNRNNTTTLKRGFIYNN